MGGPLPGEIQDVPRGEAYALISACELVDCLLYVGDCQYVIDTAEDILAGVYLDAFADVSYGDLWKRFARRVAALPPGAIAVEKVASHQDYWSLPPPVEGGFSTQQKRCFGNGAADVWAKTLNHRRTAPTWEEWQQARATYTERLKVHTRNVAMQTAVSAAHVQHQHSEATLAALPADLLLLVQVGTGLYRSDRWGSARVLRFAPPTDPMLTRFPYGKEVADLHDPTRGGAKPQVHPRQRDG